MITMPFERLGVVTAPERLQTYLDNPGGKRLPFSCTLAVLKEGVSVGDLLEWATLSLKSGAGVKLVIDPTYRLPEPSPDFEIWLPLASDHPDWQLASPEDIAQVGIYSAQRVDRNVPHPAHPEDDIESIARCFKWVEGANPCTINLSDLRPRDSVNSDGLLASGPVAFALVFRAIEFWRRSPSMHSLLRLFGTLNEVILRGGYKKGIITSACHDQSPYFDEYLKVPLVSLRGSHKKGVILSEYPDAERADLVCQLVNEESVFLQKHQSDRLFSNVCMGILLEDKGTCLIIRVNLGLIDNFTDLRKAFREATKRAILSHVDWREEHSVKARLWADLETDNQVAVDVMGLQNLLSRFDISYADFISALKGEAHNSRGAWSLVNNLEEAYTASVLEANLLCDLLQIPRMARLHTVEPAQAHSYRTQDADGNTTCRGIWPPFSATVNRYSHSSEEPVHTYYHGLVEDLTPQQHFDLCAAWQTMMDTYGRPHTISYDTWEYFTPDVLAKWWDSPLQTVYYNMTRDYEARHFARKIYKKPSLCSACED